MTIDEISRTLPNGFHDAKLLGIEIDFAREAASMSFALDISDSENGSNVIQRRGCVRLTGLIHFVIEPPDENYAYDQQFISSDSSDFSRLATAPRLPTLPTGSFAHWFYSSANSFLYVAAANAEFEWTE
jgi:hypothetical protein